MALLVASDANEVVLATLTILVELGLPAAPTLPVARLEAVVVGPTVSETTTEAGVLAAVVGATVSETGAEAEADVFVAASNATSTPFARKEDIVGARRLKIEGRVTHSSNNSD